MRAMLIGILVFAFGGIGLNSGALAQASTVDCAKAKSYLSRALCEFPRLMDLDQRIQAQYSGALELMSETADQDIENGQREWLEHVQLACTVDGQVRTSSYGKSDLECLVWLNEERLTTLGRTAEIGGHLFYWRDLFLVLPDPYLESMQPVGLFTYSEVRMDGESELSRAYNAFAAAGVGEEPVTASSARAQYDGSTEQSAIVEVVGVNNRRISSVLENYVYGHGSAHGVSGLQYAHFLIPEMRALVATDIFVGPDWVEKLDALVLPLVDDLFEEDLGWGITTLADTVSNPTAWNFKPEGLEIQFQSYEVGPYSMGRPTVMVPWHDLSDMLTEDAMDIVNGA